MSEIYDRFRATATRLVNRFDQEGTSVVVRVVTPRVPIDSDLSTGLNLSNTYAGPATIPAYFGGSPSDSVKPLTLIARQVEFPDPFSTCYLFEMGTNSSGLAVALTPSGFLLVYMGDLNSSSSSYGFNLDLSGIVDPGSIHDLAFEFNPVDNVINMWVDTDLVRSHNTVGVSEWSGSDDGGYYQLDMGGLQWPTPGGDLEVYLSQSPIPRDESLPPVVDETISPIPAVARGVTGNIVTADPNIQATDIQLIVDTQTGWVPATSEYIELNGKTRAIVRVDAIPAAGDPVAYRFFVR